MELGRDDAGAINSQLGGRTRPQLGRARLTRSRWSHAGRADGPPSAHRWPVPGSRRQAANEIDRALDNRRLPVDIMVMTPEHVARDLHVRGTLARPAVAKGHVLYAQLPA